MYDEAMNWSQDSLAILGLNKTEVEILACLTSAKSVQNISKATGLSRTGINYSLKVLISKGLISPIQNNKRILYLALTPQELIGKFQQTADDIAISMDETKKGVRIRTSKENEFIIHIGSQEIIPAYERIASMHKNERIKAIQHHRSYNALLKRITHKQLVQFNTFIRDHNLIIEGVVNEGAYDSYKVEIRENPSKFKDTIESLTNRMADYSYFPDKFFNSETEIWLFKSTALLISWNEEVAIEITNQQMASFLKDMFEFVKTGCRKIDHNEAMRKLLAVK